MPDPPLWHTFWNACNSHLTEKRCKCRYRWVCNGNLASRWDDIILPRQFYHVISDRFKVSSRWCSKSPSSYADFQLITGTRIFPSTASYHPSHIIRLLRLGSSMKTVLYLTFLEQQIWALPFATDIWRDWGQPMAMRGLRGRAGFGGGSDWDTGSEHGRGGPVCPRLWAR